MPMMRLGGPVTLNAVTTGGQIGPSVATLTDGRLITTWWSNDPGDGDGSCIRARLFLPDMSGAVYTDFIVNSTTQYSQYYSSVTALANGGFAIAWYSYEDAGSARAIRVRTYTATGSPTGPDAVVFSGLSSDPVITALSDGSFVVSSVMPGGLYYRVYNSAGVATGAPVFVDNGDSPSLTTLPDGRFLLSWSDSTPGDGSGAAVYAGIYNATGVVVSPRQINTTTTGAQSDPVVAPLANGGFVAAWRSDDGGDGSGSCIRAMFYGPDLEVVGSDSVATFSHTGNQTMPTFAVLPDGRFFMCWLSEALGTGANATVRGVLYDQNGSRIGGEFTVSTEAPSMYYAPDVSVTLDGRIVVTWTSLDAVDGSGSAARATVFDPNVIMVDAGEGPIVGSGVAETFYGSISGDAISAGGGNDSIFGQSGNDSLYGWLGDDVIFGGSGNDSLGGMEGNDFISGDSGADTLYGDAGDDTLAGGELGDVMYGGAGFDIADYSHGTGNLQVNLLTGSTSGGAVGDTFDSIEGIIGSIYGDTLHGDNVGNLLEGGQGQDSLYGNNGNDTLFGGAGANWLQGDAGADLFGIRVSEATAGSTIADYRGADGDVVRVMGGALANISLTGAGGSRFLVVDGVSNTVSFAEQSIFRMQWMPFETQTDLRDGVVRGYDVGGGYNWSVYTDYFDSQGRWTHQAGSYDSGSNAGGVYVHDVDETNTQSYFWYRNEANSSGQTFRQTGETDDGRGWVSAISGGQLTEQAWTDNNGSRNWSSYTDHYDSSVNFDYQVGVYDSGLQWMQDYDQNNANWYRYFRNEFTSNMTMVQQVGQKDDGTNWNSIYTNGQLTLVQWSDSENAYSWASFTDILGNYAGGYGVHRIGMNDNGTTFDTYF